MRPGRKPENHPDEIAARRKLAQPTIEPPSPAPAPEVSVGNGAATKPIKRATFRGRPI
jgi:hypothetical protein